MKRKSSIFLAVLLSCLAILGACKDPNNSSGSGDSTSTNGGQEYTGSYEGTDGAQHLVDASKLLHKVNVTESNRTFIVNQTTDYMIVLGTNNAAAVEAANFLAGQIEQATGAFVRVCIDADQDMLNDEELAANRDLSYNATSKYIVYSHQKMEETANVVWEAGVDLAYSGYMIKTAGDSVFMKVNTLYGYQTATLAFLREVLGYKWYSEDTIVYTRSGATLPNMDIVERPDFDLVNNWGMTHSARIGSGMTKEAIFTTINGNFCHNSFNYLSPKKYNDSGLEEYHPKWYATGKGQTSNYAPTQLCYSAHGDQEEYDAMLQTAYESVMKVLDEQPNAASLTFTREDEYGNCECDVCSLMVQEYGTLTSTYMLFTNDLDDLVQAELERRALETNTQKRALTILFFAYRETYEAPVKTVNGKYEMIKTTVAEDADGAKRNVIMQNGEAVALPYNRLYNDGLKCNENVGVFYAPIDATYEENFYHLENKQYAQTFEKWAVLSKRLYGWIYDTNFVHYLVPYNSFDSIAETLRFLKDNGCQYVFNQAQDHAVCTGFGNLKTYLNMTLARNVNLNAGTLMDEWFENYFKDAAQPMRKYYESLVGHMQQLEVQYPEVFYSQRRTESEESRYWPLAKLESWLALCDEAYNAIEKYKTTDPALYDRLKKHITIETIFPRFMICEYYAGYYKNDAIEKERRSFYADCEELGFKYYAERVPLTGWFTKWGVI